MANKFATRLAQAPSGSGDGASHTAYTCPTGRKAYVTHIHFANTGGAVQAASAALNNGTNSFAITTAVPVLPNDPGEDFFSQPGYILNAGETLDIAIGTTLAYIVNGYEEIVS
jgi:hypothetical protein